MPLVFLQPLFLLGILAGSLPVIIHLIHRQKRRRVPFSTLQFLLQTDRRSARKYRLVDFLLLLLRVLALILLALALSQPVMRPPGTADMEFGKLSLGIVIDDSLSMQRAEGGVSIFDRAIEAAREILDTIPQDGEAFIVLSSGRTPASVSVPTSPPSMLSDPLGEVPCSYGGRPLATAVNKAAEVLAGSKLRHRALVVITDLQERAFRLRDTIQRDVLAEEVQSVQVLDLSGSRVNLGILEVSASPRVAFPGTPVRVRAQVFNSAAEPAEARVSLWVDDQKVGGEVATLGGESAGQVVFSHVLNRAGTGRMAVRLEPDALSGDNAHFIALRVLPAARALVIAPHPEESRVQAGTLEDESVFLKTALNPLTAANYSGASPVQVTALTYQEARAARLNHYGFVVVVESPDMPDYLRESIREYVDQGGRIMRFPSRAWLDRIRAGGAIGRDTRLGPLPLRGAWAQAAGENAQGFGDISREHPIFSLLAASAPELFAAVTVSAHLTVDENRLGAQDTVIARYADGAPLLLESRTERGLEMTWTVGCHPDWTDLPLRPLFLPILFEALKYAEGERAGRMRGGTVDEGFSIELVPQPDPRPLRVGRPSGREERLTLMASQDMLDYYEADEPGFYTVDFPAERRDPMVVAVNAETEESNLLRLSEEDLGKVLPEGMLSAVAGDAASVAERLSYTTRGYPLAGWLLILALACLLGEIYLSNTLLRAEQDRPNWLRRLQEKLGWS